VTHHQHLIIIYIFLCVDREVKKRCLFPGLKLTARLSFYYPTGQLNSLATRIIIRHWSRSSSLPSWSTGSSFNQHYSALFTYDYAIKHNKNKSDCFLGNDWHSLAWGVDILIQLLRTHSEELQETCLEKPASRKEDKLATQLCIDRKVTFLSFSSSLFVLRVLLTSSQDLGRSFGTSLLDVRETPRLVS